MENLEEIVKAIDKFRTKHGIKWKSKLKTQWFNNENHNPFLQQFRNRFSFDILEKIKYHSTKREIIEILTETKR